MRAFTQRRSESVASLGEAKLIAAIRRWVGSASPPPPYGMGDDCAVVPAGRGKQLLKIDPLIYGRHFDDSVSPRDAGAKLLKRSLSDIAAMGGRPTAAVIALTLEPRVSLAWLKEFHRGLAACARRYRVKIVGGDIAQADGILAASLALLGTAPGRPVTRRGARIGDWIYVTGRLGGSLRSGRHHSFEPRLKEGAWLARQSSVRAMMDVSDGLAKDIWALTPNSALPALDPAAIPRHPGATLRQALSDGEDYELVFVLASSADGTAFERRWKNAFARMPLTRIGRFVRSNALPSGAIPLSEYRGYEHLR